MSNTNEIKFLTHLKSYKKIYDPIKSNCYIEDPTTIKGSTFYRAIGDYDTNGYLSDMFLTLFDANPSDASLKRINQSLGFEAQKNINKSTIHSRVAKIDNKIYINLGSGKIVRVTSSGVTILKNSKVKFEINNQIGEIVRPDLEHGNYKMIKKYIPLHDHELKLILVFIFNAYFTDTHYTMLALIGPTGSGKSCIQEFIKTIIDPSKIMLRNQFTKTEDLVLAALHCHVIDINNVSKLSDLMQDTLCTILTGGVSTTRTKYTNKAQSSIYTHNPVIINGIGNVINRDDLYERSIVFHLKKIQGTEIFLEESQLEKELEDDLPKIIGGIFNSLSLILKEFECFETPPNLNRMADFHILGCVTEKALGWKSGSFTKAYNANIAIAQNEVLEDSPLAQALLKMKKTNQSEFSGSFSELEQKLNQFGKLGKISPRQLSSDLDRISGFLLNLHNISVTKLKRSNSGSRVKITFS